MQVGNARKSGEAPSASWLGWDAIGGICELCGWAGAPVLRCVAFIADQAEPIKVATDSGCLRERWVGERQRGNGRTNRATSRSSGCVHSNISCSHAR